MYRTLIVDDEPLMRQYLGEHLSDICPEFCVTGIACDGLEAVELLQKQSFDLVITDIKMPEMDGLNLAKHIFDSELGAKVIIISGYNEFEYARLAIKYGVSDYLLKPLSDEDIYETLSKIKAELTSESVRADIRISVNSYDHYSDQEVKEELLSALLRGNTGSIPLLYHVLQDRKINFDQGYYAIMLLCIDELHLMLQEKRVLENTSYSLELYQRIKAYCYKNNYSLIYEDEGYTLILLCAKSEEDIAVSAKAIQEELLTGWDRIKPKILSAFGYIVNDMMGLRRSYSSAVEALALSLKNVHSPISSRYYVSQSKFITELGTICEALYADYISQNTNKSLSDLYLYISLFEDEITIAAILRYGSYLIRYLARKCNIKTDYVLSSFQELMLCIDRSMGSSTFDKDSVHALFLRVIKILGHDDPFILIPETTNTVESAKEFICTHYHEQISLAMVADHLKVNSSYLSDLFHKSMGEPYTKFLTRIRMEQALLLLKSNPNEKIYKIADKTGFVSAKHFNNVFKKYYGFTPTEYINKNLL